MELRAKLSAAFVFLLLIIGSHAPAFAQDDGAPEGVAAEAAASEVRTCDLALGLPQSPVFENLPIPQAKRAKAKQLAKKYGVENFAGTDYYTLINSVYLKIKRLRRVQRIRADTMARFGMELDSLMGKVKAEIRRPVWFGVGLAVTHLERYETSEFVDGAGAAHAVADKRPGLVHFKDFAAYAKGFIDNKPPFSNHAGWGEGGIIGVSEYRDIVMYNIWPVWMKPHDLLHVYFAYGHALGTSLLYKSARSKNHRRFVMLAAIYEGVDTIQYTHESKITRYFEKKKIGLHDALLWTAKATQAELDQMVESVGLQGTNQTSFEQEMKSWAPKYKGDLTPHGLTGNGLDAELMEFVERSHEAWKNPDEIRYLNYHRRADDTNGATWDKDYAHNYSMSLNVGPTAPPPVSAQPRRHFDASQLRLTPMSDD